MVEGTMQATDIMIFIFVLGGLIGVVKESGAFESGLMSLTKKTKGHEFILVFLVAILLVLGGYALRNRRRSRGILSNSGADLYCYGV